VAARWLVTVRDREVSARSAQATGSATSTPRARQLPPLSDHRVSNFFVRKPLIHLLISNVTVPIMSGKGKRNSAASTYSSSKKRRERELSPSSESQQESDSKASPRRKSNKSSEKPKTNGSKKPRDAESSDEDMQKDDGDGDDDDEDEEEEYEVETIKKHRKSVTSLPLLSCSHHMISLLN
jgi:hypothetical protein